MKLGRSTMPGLAALWLAPLAMAGGGVDNDAPFGAPNKPGSSGGSTSSYMASTDNCATTQKVQVSVSPGATFHPGDLKPFAPKVELAGSLVLSTDPAHPCAQAFTEETPTAATITVEEGNVARGATVSSGIVLQGAFTVQGSAQVLLKTSHKQGTEVAFLAVGSPSRDGGMVPEHLIQIPLAGGGVDVSAYARLLAQHSNVLGGKVAKIVVYSIHPGIGTKSPTIHEEGSVTFPIREGSKMRVQTRVVD